MKMAQEFKEKTIIVNLSKAFNKPTTKRAVSAKNMLKKAVVKETRMKDIKLSNGINEAIWARGRYNAPRRITIKVVADKETARVMLPTEKYDIKQDKKKGAKADAKKDETKKETEKKGEAKKEPTKTEAKKDTPKIEIKTESPKQEEKK